ncbi:MAG TPA: peptidyl-prolyl cis-trans isomerase [Thermoanaerobaculia bacterium]
MNRYLPAALALAIIVPAADAQPNTADARKIVAKINGEVISRARIDLMWDRVPPHLQKQYELVGGRPTFLNNYVRKRVLLQHALKNGFGNELALRVELDPAEESALFDRYVREVVANNVVTDQMLRQAYQENRGQFAHPDQVKLRHIFIDTTTTPGSEAREKLTAIHAELDAYRKSVADKPNAKELLRERFAAAARQHSGDPAAPAGGLVGWIGMSRLDARVGEAAFTMEVGTMSGVIQAERGMHILFIDAEREAGIEPFEVASPDIREFLLTQNMQKVLDEVNKQTTELLAKSKVEVYPDNL